MFKLHLLLTPFASWHTVETSNGGLVKRHYSNYFVFGFRIARLHRNKT